MKRFGPCCLGFLTAGIILLSSFVLFSDHHWFFRYFALLFLGAVLSLAMMPASSPALLRTLARLPFGSPNWISLWRLPIVFTGIGTFFYTDDLKIQLIGFLITVVGFTLDRIDGKAAKVLLQDLRFLPDNPVANNLLSPDSLWAWYQVEEEDSQGRKILVDKRVVLESWIFQLTDSNTNLPMFHIEMDLQATPPTYRLTQTKYGESIDPAIDKIKFLLIFCYLGHLNMLAWSVVIAMGVVEFLGTILRPPFINWPIIRGLKQYISTSQASQLGKTKFFSQAICLLLVMPMQMGWLAQSEQHYSLLIASSSLAFSVFAGVLSIISRLTIMSYLLNLLGLVQAYKHLRQWYEHDVSESKLTSFAKPIYPQCSRPTSLAPSVAVSLKIPSALRTGDFHYGH